MSEKKFRVLCLHGYRQNSILFREKTGSFRKLMKKYADFEFVSAPLIPNVPDEEKEYARAWWFSRLDDEFSSGDLTRLARGFDESLRKLDEFIAEKGPFDGLFGFSQGASMCHLLLARNKSKPKLNNFNQLRTCHFEIPSFHIYGEDDDIVNMKRSMELATKFENSISVLHKGGHCVPPMSQNKEVIAEFFNSI